MPDKERTPASCTAQVGRGGSGDFATILARPRPVLEGRYVKALSAAASASRFAAYNRAAGHDTELACRLYLWDRDVEAAILRDIAVVEVALRNALTRQLEAALGKSWHTSSALNVDKRLTGARDRALDELRKLGRRPTSANVTAQLSLGFWVNLLNAPADPLWRQTLHAAFPGGKTEAAKDGQRFQRAWVLSVLQVMRNLRNRCAHHEPLLRGFPLPGRLARLSAADGIAAYTKIARMIDRDLADWLDGDTAALQTIASRPGPAPEAKV